MSQYNYSEIISWLEQKGIELYCKSFKIQEMDHAVIHKLVAYFLNDEITCFQLNIDIKKDLILRGGQPVAVR